MVAYHPLALPPEGREDASYIKENYSFLGSILTAIFGSCVLAHVFSAWKKRQGRLFAGKVDECLLGRADAVLLDKGPPSSAKMLV